MRALSILLLLLIFLGGGWLATQVLLPLNSNAPVVRIEVKKGGRAIEVSENLHSLGVVKSAHLIHVLGRVTGDWNRLKAGEYEVSAALSPLQILKKLTTGIPIQYPITVIEGQNRFEIAAEIEKKGMGNSTKIVNLTEDPEFIDSFHWNGTAPKTLEGYLSPNTYLFPLRVTEEEILKTMILHFLNLWTQERELRAESLGMTRNEIVTLASIIEKETGASSERKQISSVFHNRLKKRMRLQSDPTTIYGIWRRFDGNLRKNDLLEHTAWNTYAIPGLPLTPISNPGVEAIDAALWPETTPFLYFVSQNNGTHVFSDTYEKHLAAVRAFQLNPQARQGKSWRNLNKKETN